MGSKSTRKSCFGVLTVIVMQCLPPASTSLAAERVRLGEAEVGFRMHLGRMKLAGLDVSQEEMDSLAVHAEDGRTIGVWKGHPLFGADFTVTAEFEEKDEGWEYSFRWEGLEGWRLFVETVSFPDLVVPRTDGSGVVYSRAHGMGMVRRPKWPEWGWEREPFVNEAMREFQFTALVDDEKPCWYLDARDSEARAKYAYAYCRVGLSDPHARIGIRSSVPMLKELTNGYVLPWKGLIRPFRGGWWEAAQIYRPWALRQPWAQTALGRKAGPAHARLREICFWAWNRGGCEAVSRPLEKFAEDTGLPCALHWDWWHRYTKDVGYPTYWPPYEGAEKFVETVSRLKAHGCYTMVYMNGMSRDRDDASWGEEGERDAQYEHDGTIHGHHWNPHTHEPHRLTTVCGEGRGFQKLIQEQVSHLANAGLDAVYLDQVSCAAAKPCWSPYHRHPKGDLLASLHGYHRYLQEIRARHPSLQLGSEEVSEAFLCDFDLFISLFGTSYERCGLGVLPEFEAVPVWNALYHGLSAVFGTYLLVDGIPPWDEGRWPSERKWRKDQELDWQKLFPDQFFVEFARTVAWGNQPTVHAFRIEHATDPGFAAEYRFMKETAKFYHENRDVLFDGTLLAPGTLACQTRKVDFQRRGIYHPAGKYDVVTQPALPTVFHNVWRSTDGKVCAIAVNWSETPQEFDLSCPSGAAKGELPPRCWRRIDLNTTNKD